MPATGLGSRPAPPTPRRFTVAASALIVAVTAGSVASPTPVEAQQSFGVSAVHFVVDVSGSMADDDGAGKIKIDGAKEAMAAMLTSLDTRISIGMRSYPDDSDCGVSPNPDAPIGTDRSEIGSQVRNLRAGGGTPTGEALRAAGNDLRASGFTTKGVIVLVSDGQSTCDADPCDVAVQLSDEFGIDVAVSTIGFQISPEGREELECIADATGGRYVDVDDVDELEDSLQELAAAALTLNIDAPSVLVRSVGIGETLGRSPDVEIRATIRNTSGNIAGNVRAVLTFTGERRPFAVRPVRTVGNLEAFDSIDVIWRFAPPLDFSDVDVDYTVAVGALNAPTVTQDRSVSLRGSIRLDDAGDILQNRDHVAILGDSYSAGEGTRDYLPGTDTDANPCHRSNATYGADLWPGSRSVIACSGALTRHLDYPQHDAVRPQLDQLRDLHATRPVDLVLMTLGGNDAQFSTLIATCLVLDCNDARAVYEVSCSTAGSYRTDSTNAFLAPDTGCLLARSTLSEHHEQLVTDVVPRLADAYSDIDRVINNGVGDIPIIVLAYPSPVPDGVRFDEVVNSCTATFSLDYDEWRYAVQFAQRMNAAVETAVGIAQQRGVPVHFVADSADAFEPSHTVCDTDPYLNPLDVAGTAVTAAGVIARIVDRVARFVSPREAPLEVTWPSGSPAEREFKASFHPNSDGYRAMTAALVEWSKNVEERDNIRPMPAPSVFTRKQGPTIVLPSSGTLPPLQPGSEATIMLQGMQQGAPVSVMLESTLARVGAGYVDADGTARVPITIPDGLELGAHTLHVSSITADGQPHHSAWPVTAQAATTVWQRWSPIAAGICAVVALLAVATLLLLRRVRRHSSAQQHPAIA